MLGLIVDHVQISKFALKNWLNAAQDLVRVQLLLLGDNRPYVTLRQHPRLFRFIGTFRRMEATARRR